jgi:CubicO group peptidase (beta-lactamase class C family)
MKSCVIFLGLSLFLGILAPSQSLAQAGNSFPESRPEAQGIPSDAIFSMVERFEAEIDAVHSFMIVRHGYLVAQGWWAPYAAEVPHIMHSLSKSFTSTAVGMLVDAGKLSLDDRVMTFFPDDLPVEPSQQLQAMRIRDLLTMNTGHRTAPRLRDHDRGWERAFLHGDIEFKPGIHFQYNSAATYMLSAIVQKVTGQRLVDYLNSRFFEPLGISKPSWDLSPDGVNTGGWGLSVTTETIAKLGQVYLQRGLWRGRRLLSESWIDQATSKQTSNGSNPESDWEQGYGFQFWRCRHNAYRGDGAFGQFCIVMPEHELVIAVTSGTSDMGAVMNVIWETLLPGVSDSALPDNRASWEALATKLSQLKLSPVSGESRSPLAAELVGQTFALSTNDMGVRALRFDLKGEEHQITILTDTGAESILLGTDNYAVEQIKGDLPNAKNVGRSIGASGAWIQPNEYQAKIYFREAPASLDYTFRFEDGGVEWLSKLNHSLTGLRRPVVVEGRRK